MKIEKEALAPLFTLISFTFHIIQTLNFLKCKGGFFSSLDFLAGIPTHITGANCWVIGYPYNPPLAMLFISHGYTKIGIKIQPICLLLHALFVVPALGTFHIFHSFLQNYRQHPEVDAGYGVL